MIDLDEVKKEPKAETTTRKRPATRRKKEEDDDDDDNDFVEKKPSRGSAWLVIRRDAEDQITRASKIQIKAKEIIEEQWRGR